MLNIWAEGKNADDFQGMATHFIPPFPFISDQVERLERIRDSSPTVFT